MSTPAPLARIEEITGASGIAPRIEALLPIGVRHRQLRVRTLLAGMLLTQADCRPAHLTRVRDALTSLPAADQARPGVTEDWAAGPHQLTTGRPSGLPGWSPPRWQRTSRTGCPPPASPRSAMTCWRPPSPARTSRPPPRWRWTGPTWKPFPAPAPRHQRVRRPRGLLGPSLPRSTPELVPPAALAVANCAVPRPAPTNVPIRSAAAPRPAVRAARRPRQRSGHVS